MKCSSDLFIFEHENTDMKLTVSELARAVKKNEAYVRQHMRRGHLKTVKVGRNVFVEPEDAARWAIDRGLPFDLPNRPTFSVDSTSDRIARVAVLAWHPKDGQPFNLFTHIRHRRKEALGPWAKEPDEHWMTTAITTADDVDSGEIRLHCMDATFEHCEQLIDGVLADGLLNVNDSEIHYKLVGKPRRHWAYQDERGQTEPTITSPFSNSKYSAEVIEYWSFAEETSELWLDVVASRQNDLQPLLAKLRFPLDRHSDRVGNFVISGALDWVNCDLAVRRNRALVLTVDGEEATTGAYTAEVWACHSGDDVLRRMVPIEVPETVLELHSNVDRIGFSLYRNRDGLCVNRLDAHLIMEINIAMDVDGGPTVQLNNRKNSSITTLSPFSHRSMIKIESDKDSLDLDKAIRREVLDRRARERETAARREQDLARFGPDEFDAAVEYFVRLLSRHTYVEEPVYLADRYFLASNIGADERLLYLRMFTRISDRPLRILCTQNSAPSWWSGQFSTFAKGVAVKACLASGNTPAFHDRYLVTPEAEILISNSFNNWRKHGVTLASLPYGVYRSEAEHLWATGVSVI